MEGAGVGGRIVAGVGTVCGIAGEGREVAGTDGNTDSTLGCGRGFCGGGCGVALAPPEKIFYS